MSLILVTNDDGIHAPGIRALYDALKDLAETYIVAPDRERSASSHSLTIHNPIKVQEIDAHTFSVSGTPTDCVAVGALKLLPEKPSLIVSGINHGPNLGDDVTYSGTVSAALEGTIMNIPSFAISLNVLNNETPLFDAAASFARTVAQFIFKNCLPIDTLLNINVPNTAPEHIKGTKITRLGRRVYEGAINETFSPWHEKYFWIGGGTAYWEHGDDTDMNAVSGGYMSVTPIHLDLTNHEVMDLIKKQWEL